LSREEAQKAREVELTVRLPKRLRIPSLALAGVWLVLGGDRWWDALSESK